MSEPPDHSSSVTFPNSYSVKDRVCDCAALFPSNSVAFGVQLHKTTLKKRECFVQIRKNGPRAYSYIHIFCDNNGLWRSVQRIIKAAVIAVRKAFMSMQNRSTKDFSPVLLSYSFLNFVLCKSSHAIDVQREKL